MTETTEAAPASAPPAFSPTLYAEALAAFDEAGWHRAPSNPGGTFGTVAQRDGRTIAGSLAVRGTSIRYLAYGVPTNGREDALAEVFRRVNPSLDVGAFELDPLVGPACRTGADLGGLLDEEGRPVDAEGLRLTILGLAATATAVFETFVNVLDDVASGADAEEALDDAGWIGDGRDPAPTGRI